jgi:hypothetical protein
LPSITLRAAILNAAAVLELSQTVAILTTALQAADRSSQRLGNILVVLNFILAGAAVMAALAAIAELLW